MPQLRTNRVSAAECTPAPGGSVRLPIHFFSFAILFFALGTATAPWAALKLADYFYQLQVLAWVHTFTLGWITSALVGLTYRYVPQLTRRELKYPRLATLQLLLYVLGASGVVAHFMLGSWDGVWMAGVVVALSVVLLAINVVPCMAPRFGRGVAETGLLTAIFFLLCASSLGTVLAFDKQRSLILGTLLGNLSAHAHLAVLGWITTAICALSYRLVTTIIAEQEEAPHLAMAQILVLAAATIALFLGLIAGIGNVVIWSALVALALASYAFILRTIIGSHAPGFDWTSRHTLAAVLCLLLAVAGGISLAITGAATSFGAHLACAYGLLGLLGWAGNFIIGLSYQMFAEFVARVRSALGWPCLSVAELSISAGRPLVFYSLNAGILLMAGGLIAGEIAIAQAGAVLIALGGLVYSAAMGWTLSFAYRRAAPAATDRLLGVAND